MNPKSVFLEDKELVKWWVAVVHDPRFDKVAALALATVSKSSRTIERVDGASVMIETLSEFAEPQVTHSHFPSPGLIHETPKRITETDKPKA